MSKWISPSTPAMRLPLRANPPSSLASLENDECREKSLLARDVREMNGPLCFFCNEKSNDIEEWKKRLEILL